MLTATEVGRVIKEQRAFVGISQADLSAESGVPSKTLARLEAGRTNNPSVFDLYAICVTLDMTLDDLMDWAEEEG